MLNLNDNDRKELSRKYGRTVKTITNYGLSVEADMFLNKDRLVFSAHLNGQNIESKDGNKVEEWIARQLKDACQLEWIPVICVLDTQTDSHSWNTRKLDLHQISIDVHRFNVAVLPDKTLRAVEWDVPDDKRLTSQSSPFHWAGKASDKAVVVDGKIKLPVHDKHSHILPYSESLWTGLNELMVGIDHLRNQLHNLLKSDSGIIKLESVGSKILKLLTE